jgi:alpha-L-fucosidase 2
MRPLFTLALSVLYAGMMRPARVIAQPQAVDIAASIENRSFDPSTLLWYDKPAIAWEDALPVGNGRLGAMIFGRTAEERIQLNEATWWTGGPYSTVVAGGFKSLPEVRRLVFAGEFQKAHDLFGRTLMGYPVEQQKYQPLADLHLFFPGRPAATAYRRWLDLRTGIAGVQYIAGGVHFREEVFSSAPDQVLVVRLTADRPGAISVNVVLRGVRNQAHSNYATDYFRMDGLGPDGLVTTGKSADYLGIKGQLHYEARIRAVPEGGTMALDGAMIKIGSADAVTLYFTAATNFVNYHDVSGDPHSREEQYAAALATTSYPSIREAHLSDYRDLFDRVRLKLPVTDRSWLPTDTRKASLAAGPDPSLAALSYQFGRYLLISSSRKGGQPANLQGIWNDNPNPMWDSKYTTNINTQMNYWPAEPANLSECAEPLVQMIKELSDQGSEVAREHYGCRGWVFHQNTDLWRVAAPMDGPTWGTFTVGGAWLCTHLWEHYLFTGDTAFLREVYPLLKGSTEFFLDFLVSHPNGKWLVTNPSGSPENFPARPGNQRYFDEVTGSFLPGTTICAGSSIDMQVLADLFKEFAAAARILDLDPGMVQRADSTRDRLVPPQTGKDGSLQEWTEDWGQTEHPHRHLSPLYGLYPGNVFSLRRTPQWIAPIRNVLIQRGDSSAEWSRAWKVGLWARLHDGDHANAILKGYLRDASNPQLFGNHGFPIQVDGPLGVAAGIGEMLVQSQEDYIEWLPALPAEWSEGSAEGLCARGAFLLSLHWAGGKMTTASILSRKGNICRVFAGRRGSAGSLARIMVDGKRVSVKRLPGDIVEFPTVKGNTYTLVFI